MKTFPSALAAKYASGSTSFCAFLRVVRQDGLILGFCSADHDVSIPDFTVAGILVPATVYQSAPGLGISSLVSAAGASVDNMELTVSPDETAYPQVDIIAGRWDNAAFVLGEVDHLDPTAGINILKRGRTGEATTLRSSNKFEFRGLKQGLQQSIGTVVSKTCNWRLYSTAKPYGLCFVDPTPFTHEHTVSAIEGAHQFTCSGTTEPIDYYGEGSATGVGGPNDGYSVKVKDFAAGVFTLALPFPFPVSIGDVFRFQAGCRKRHSRTLANPTGVSDCADKFFNVVNFGGEPHGVGIDQLTAPPDLTNPS